MKRNTDESFEDYKVRRAAQNKADKAKSKGRLVWPAQKIPYVKAIHGELL